MRASLNSAESTKIILVHKETEASCDLQDIWNRHIFIFTAGQALWQRWLVVGLWFFFSFSPFLTVRIRILLKIFPQSFYIYEYLILLLKVQKKLRKIRFGVFSRSTWKKAWALNNEMPLSLCCTAGILHGKYLRWKNYSQDQAPSVEDNHSPGFPSATEMATAGFGAYLQPIFYGLLCPYKTWNICLLYMISAYVINFFPR